MAEVILMPRLSDTMTEGVVAVWHKQVGDKVQKGEILAEIETDKATMELESYQNGVLLHIGTPNGGKLQVNDLLAILGEPEEDVQALVAKHQGGVTAQSSIDPSPAPSPSVSSTTISSSNIDISQMEEVVLMPRLSDTMTEGVIASWQKNVGDAVKKGEILAEIETDKATMELESYKDGILLHQGAAAGEKIQVNDLLCIIGQPDFDIQAVIAAAKSGGAATVASTSPATNEPSTTPAPVPSVAASSAAPVVVNDGRILASPLARKLAAEKGIDLRYVQGSGDQGRIIKSDVDQYKAPQTAAPAPSTTAPTIAAPQVAAAPLGTVSFDEVPVSQMRKTIARRLSESLFTAPHFYLTMRIDMDACVAARAKLNEQASVKISFNDMVIKAVSLALRQHPKVNSSWLGDTIRYNHHVNIGVAVAVDEGLLVPVVRHANLLSLTQIASQVKEFAQKAKDKKLQPADWEGSTFTISNLGMYGIDQFTAIINPPDACILAVGGIQQEPVVKNGAVVPGNVMKVTLSCDHRVVDGATGSAFLQTLKQLLEEPLRMML